MHERCLYLFLSTEPLLDSDISSGKQRHAGSGRTQRSIQGRVQSSASAGAASTRRRHTISFLQGYYLMDTGKHTIIVDHYRLIRLLGKGRWSEVYLGQHIFVPQMQYAIKKPAARSPESLQTLQRRAAILLQLDHPCILKPYPCRDLTWLSDYHSPHRARYMTTSHQVTPSTFALSSIQHGTWPLPWPMPTAGGLSTGT
jgi:serine/threonine protein kinase